MYTSKFNVEEVVSYSKPKMIILLVLVFSQVMLCQSSHNSESIQGSSDSASHNLKKIQDILMEKIQTVRSESKSDGSGVKSGEDKVDTPNQEERGGKGRRGKSLALFPYYLPHELMPFGPPAPGYYHTQNKDLDNPYTSEWLSRTEPFKRNTPLLDSPTYYIRLPPNPYAFVPGMGYVSRPPSLSDPEVFESNKPESPTQSGNDLFHDPFYRLPINFVSNGKPTGVYQLENEPAPKPESNFVNLNKGPYVFNGKPSEIYLVAQIYNALYGDELNHFYP
ncbi:hypothetical protein RUM43_004538 [Polyplax serrata]|uniref:Uncharacterized protein n=1 Tax=Polyplax serrata TaxID=468196 RepID=A0AAN8SAY6_POLSC